MMEDKLTEAEAMKQQPPWNFDELVTVSAQHILVAARRAGTATTNGAQVNVLETKDKRGSDHGPRPDQKCPCCGQPGHRPRDCPTTCKECKQRSCPGNYGSNCVVFARHFPPHVANALGKPVPPNIKTILQKAHDKKTAQSAQGLKKSVNALEATAISTDNPHVWEAMLNEDGRTSNVLEALKPPPAPIVSSAFDHIKEACPTFKQS
ncbi:hypothetical protein AB1Y20_014333 [Prymnesium parvum]|uniref:CCHC-type domain-containing protein n=1 Tax=Prymnesium parvum TaxID=97485 RepID=A0AB34IEP0_PRYPA